MKRWLFALAMAAMLGIGFVAGSMLTRARAEGTAADRYQIVPLSRVDTNDPLAIKYDTQTGEGNIIFRNATRP